jgi:phage-related protein
LLHLQARCRARLGRLAELGHEIRRPEADYLRDGIHELRAKHAGINYRILYFFHERDAIVSHGLVKQRSDVDPVDIDLAIRHMRDVQLDPARFTAEE